MVQGVVKEFVQKSYALDKEVKMLCRVSNVQGKQYVGSEWLGGSERVKGKEGIKDQATFENQGICWGPRQRGDPPFQWRQKRASTLLTYPAFAKQMCGTG